MTSDARKRLAERDSHQVHHDPAVVALVERERRAAAVDALRSAARELPGFESIRTHGDAATWLRGRADAVENGGAS